MSTSVTPASKESHPIHENPAEQNDLATKKTCSLARILVILGSGMQTVIAFFWSDREVSVLPPPVTQRNDPIDIPESEIKLTAEVEKDRRRGHALFSQANEQMSSVWFPREKYPDNVNKAAALYQEAAQIHHPPSFKKLGDCYRYGMGYPQNSKKAFELYTQGDAAGDLSCSKALGDLYLIGMGTKRNIPKGLALHKKASAE